MPLHFASLSLKAFLAIATCVVLSSCASGTAFNQQTLLLAEIPQDQSLFVFYRPSSFLAGGFSPKLELNGIKTCDLPNGGYFQVNAVPGTVVISTGVKSALEAAMTYGETRQTFTGPMAGKRYYVKMYANGGSPPFSFVDVPEPQALTELSTLKGVGCGFLPTPAVLSKLPSPKK